MAHELMQEFENRKIRSAWDEKAEEWYFSVLDVVAVLTDSADPKQHIKKGAAKTRNWVPSGVQFVPRL